MKKFAPPDEPGKFKKRVNAANAAVAKAIAAKAVPKFPGHWSDYKAFFVKAQWGKCGFCEGLLRGLQYGDVEHFRPKALVHELDPANFGVEKRWDSTVKGRLPKKKTVAGTAGALPVNPESGYWWDAYSWKNYLLACQICNQQWKKNFFPVADDPRTHPPVKWVNEHELLLNPFYDYEAPGKHLQFGRLGEVTPYNDSPYGQATIETCGLDRPSLRQARLKLARTTHERIDEMSQDVSERELLSLLDGIRIDGHRSQPFCGMVQAIFEQRTGKNWHELILLVRKLKRLKRRGMLRRLCEC